MCACEQTFNWIETQGQEMRDLAVQWAGINTHTFNKSGLEKFTEELIKSFSVLREKVKRVPLSPFTVIDHNGQLSKHTIADALVIQKRPQAAKQALLVCHMDTVFPSDHHFQEVKEINSNTVNGYEQSGTVS